MFADIAPEGDGLLKFSRNFSFFQNFLSYAKYNERRS